MNDPDMEILSQPLLTEEGFLNPACMAELEGSIANVGRPHERLSSDHVQRPVDHAERHRRGIRGMGMSPEPVRSAGRPRKRLQIPVRGSPACDYVGDSGHASVQPVRDQRVALRDPA